MQAASGARATHGLARPKLTGQSLYFAEERGQSIGRALSNIDLIEQFALQRLVAFRQLGLALAFPTTRFLAGKTRSLGLGFLGEHNLGLAAPVGVLVGPSGVEARSSGESESW